MSNVWTTVWTGSYPNLCSGEWELYRNEEKIETDIPFATEWGDIYHAFQENDWRRGSCGGCI